MKPLPRSFYSKDTALVARSLLGKVLVRRLKNRLLMGKIVETEAYFGEEDPASRAYMGRPKFCVELMKGKPGRALIYMVHNNWLLNVAAHEKGKVGAVLIRAVEPLEGIETMKENRNVDSLKDLTNGPGKLTRAFGITKVLNGADLTSNKEIFIVKGKKEKFEVCKSHRIGVSRDLETPLRFFIKGNNFVSRFKR